MSVILWFSPNASTIYSGTLQFKKGNLIPTWKWNAEEKFQSKLHCLLIIKGVAKNLHRFFFLKKVFSSAEAIVHWQLKFKKFVYKEKYLVWSCSPREFQQSSPAPQFESINSLVLSFLYGPTLTFVHDYWKNHSFDYGPLSARWCLCFLICCLGLL